MMRPAAVWVTVLALAAATLPLLGAGAQAAPHAFAGLNGAIVYLSTSAPNLRNLELYAVAPNGGAARPIGDLNPAADTDPAWSPDGRRLAFASQRAGNWDVFVRDADGRLLRLTEALGNDRHPAWSPDGRLIAFESDRRGTPEIYVMEGDGSGVRRATTNTAAPSRNPNIPLPGDRSPDWSPDGRTIAFARAAPGDDGIHLITAGGADERRLTVASSFGGVHAAPAWSPDGAHIAFNREAEPDGSASTLWLMRPDGSDQRPIPGTEAAFGPEWSPDGSRLAFVRYDRFLVTIGRDGTDARQLSREADWGSRPSWSPDGTQIVFASVIDDGPFRPFLFDPAAGRATRLSDRGDPGFLASPTWSPDGSRLALVERGGLAVMNAEGAGLRALPGAGRPVNDPAWSPDGARIVFSRSTERRAAGDLFVVRADGSGLRRLTRTWHDESEPAWSPDGGWIAFVSNRDGPKRMGDYEIELIHPDGTGRRRLTQNAFYERSPDWSPDGRQLVFSSGRRSGSFNPELWVMNADGTGERRVQAAVSPDGQTIWADERPVWSPDGRWIAYESNLGEDVFIVMPDGSRKTNLTSDHRSRDYKPSWQPLCSVRGSGGADVVRGGSGDDLVCGLGGADRIFGGRGRDRLFGGAGNDSIGARDGEFDVVGCGRGRDSVNADRGDLVGVDCEQVSRAR